MTHEEAVKFMASTKFLTGELTEQEKIEFEDHFFCCHECAQEVKVDEIFAANLRAVFEDRHAFPPAVVPITAKQSPMQSPVKPKTRIARIIHGLKKFWPSNRKKPNSLS